MAKDDDFTIRGIMDLLDDAIGYVEENRDTFESIFGGSRLRLGEHDPLMEASKMDDRVIITLEVSSEEFSNVSLEYDNGKLKIRFNGKSVIADVPGDIVMEDANADLNNGVLNLEIPRRAS